mmetsp:Transcript_12208/g.29024  ORF Transcript_12208/g.29024 Transcript_12208/m.29024 type:complete len:275 (-) Transcript_12208:430-1254(-)
MAAAPSPWASIMFAWVASLKAFSCMPLAWSINPFAAPSYWAVASTAAVIAFIYGSAACTAATFAKLAGLSQPYKYMWLLASDSAAALACLKTSARASKAASLAAPAAYRLKALNVASAFSACSAAVFAWDAAVIVDSFANPLVCCTRKFIRSTSASESSAALEWVFTRASVAEARAYSAAASARSRLVIDFRISKTAWSWEDPTWSAACWFATRDWVRSSAWAPNVVSLADTAGANSNPLGSPPFPLGRVTACRSRMFSLKHFAPTTADNGRHL